MGVRDDTWAYAAAGEVRLGRPVALVTVVAAEGSTPREAGARMLVGEDRLCGTIGGGNLEFIAIDQARRLLAQSAKDWAVQDYPLGPLLSQCCGGYVRLLLERLDRRSLGWLDALTAIVLPAELTARFGDGLLTRALRPSRDEQWVGPLTRFRFLDGAGAPLRGRRPRPTMGDVLIERISPKPPRLVIFGAGHVGLAIARQFAPLPFQVEHYDARPEAETEGVTIHPEEDLIEMAALAGEDDLVCIVSHSHDLDYLLAKAVLESGRARYCGLIGSRTKRARFLPRFEEDGLTEAQISRLTCPIGIPELKGKAPEVIAVSVAAQLLQLTQDPE